MKLGGNKGSIQGQLKKVLKMKEEVMEKITKIEKQCKPEEQVKINEEIVKLERKKGEIQQKVQFLMSMKPKQHKLNKNI